MVNFGKFDFTITNVYVPIRVMLCCWLKIWSCQLYQTLDWYPLSFCLAVDGMKRKFLCIVISTKRKRNSFLSDFVFGFQLYSFGECVSRENENANFFGIFFFDNAIYLLMISFAWKKKLGEDCRLILNKTPVANLFVYKLSGTVFTNAWKMLGGTT